MKMKQTALILGLATFGLVSFAQDNKPDPVPANPPPSNTEPAKAEPADPPKADPAKADPANAEPAKADPAKADPAKADPAKADPAKAEPAKAEPAQVEVVTPPPTPVAVPVAPAVPPAAATPTPSATPATPAAPAPAPAAGGAAETVPLIVIDDVPLTDAIRNLARQSSLNFQFDPRVTTTGPATNQPNVSIRFENVTAQEALQAVLDNYNLVLVQDPKSKIARITIKDPKAEDPLFSQTIQLKYSDPTNLVTLVKSTLSPRSSVMGDPRTSQLLVTTTEKEMNAVVVLIAKLDTPTKQVLIEARLLETAHNPSTVKGIDWSGTLEAQNFQFGNGRVSPVAANATIYSSAGAPGSGTATPNGAPKLTDLAQGLFVGNGGMLANTAKGFYPATAFLNADGVSAVLSFLNKDADTEVISTPRAVTLDNQTARLEVTRAFPIFLITPGSANSPAGATITYTNLGTILQVTPRIAADKNISLRVVPEVSNIDSVDKQTLNGTVNTANIYAIRKIDTRVMIPSGNTLVMGGLINDTKNKQFTKVPILGDIPVIGLAFRKETKNRNKQNLLIFITPTIVEDDAFHPTSSGEEFLNTRIVEKPEVEESAWDSGKPHDWSKPVY